MLMIKSTLSGKEEQAQPGMLVRWQSDKRVPPEYGIITTLNDTYAFVRFFGDYHGKACEPYGLTIG